MSRPLMARGWLIVRGEHNPWNESTTISAKLTALRKTRPDSLPAGDIAVYVEVAVPPEAFVPTIIARVNAGEED